MTEFKALTESQLELLQTKVQQIRNLMQQAQALQNQNAARVERMKTELDIPAKEAKEWRISKDGKSFEREKWVKKAFPSKGKKGKK